MSNENNLNFNIKFIGDRNFLSKKINKKIDLNLENLKKKIKKYLLIYINYSGKDDIIKQHIKFK